MKLHKLSSLVVIAAILFSVLSIAPSQVTLTRAAPQAATMATGWNIIKFPTVQPACTGVGWPGLNFDRLDCGFGYVVVSNTTASSVVKVRLLDSAGGVIETQTASYRAQDNAWEFNIEPGNAINPPAWLPGEVTLRIVEVDGQTGNFGETKIFLNQLGASVAPSGSGHHPGDAVTVAGTIFEVDQVGPLAAPQQTPVGATFSLQVRLPDGQVRGPYGPFTANALDGTFTANLPAAATAGVTAGPQTNYQTTLAVEVINASYTDPLTGDWAAARAGSGSLSLSVPPTALLIENKFISSVGWVKPGDSYPFRVFVKNFTGSAASNAVVSIPAVDSTTFTQVTTLTGSGSAVINPNGSITWSIGSVAAGSPEAPVVKTLVVEARADTLGQDPEIVWKDLSSTATLTYSGGPGGLVSMAHGPKVIPTDDSYNTARYGDRPFPVVPVDYYDRKHAAAHTGEALANKINSPGIAGSTFNLYQEMSLGQLYPNADVPSAEIASKGWDYTPGFQFSDLTPSGACYGLTYKAVSDTPLYPERIVDGWYQLPGDTAYYGGDQFALGSIVGAVAGVAPLMQIDNACGPTGKAVYDAAQIADPEIDYNDFDTDKDGVVDFFMMVFSGIGGNGASQLNVPPYDNIWPHSSNLEFYYTDAATGLKGYVSDDQLTSLKGTPQCWTANDHNQFTDCAANGGSGLDSLPVYVRVGPYNVNPESAIDRASVISHEYGHSLGLPDFYSMGSRETYGDWNLMAMDKSQNMDIFARQELGWIVPDPFTPNSSVTVVDWNDSKYDTGEIHWRQPDGTPYGLSATNGDQNIHNAQSYFVKLPARQLIDPAKIAAGASPDHVWWSQSGNDFGCPPTGGHNLDVYLPELANLPSGATITVEFKSYWDIEWDYDYGFVMVSTDGGSTYQSVASSNNYTTPASQNPNTNACQSQYGNGLTGSSGSYAANTSVTDRLLGNYPDGGFVPDSYDISFAAGKATVLRFAYATDPGLARPGWFIDDLKVTANGQVIYQTNFEQDNDARLFPGGCTAHGSVAAQCTAGWDRISGKAGSPADHAYYMEMRDRSGFDFDSHGENDRDPLGFDPGLLLIYTDEAHGYGNSGVDDPPAQSPVDANPQPGNATPNLNDAAFKQGNTYSDTGPTGWVDNYADPNAASGQWTHRFNCLAFTVTSLTGGGIGPSTAPGDLLGNVDFTLGDGCVPFTYGALPPNRAPTALAQARPQAVKIHQTVFFDASASYDDLTPNGQLAYAWDFDGNGQNDATGMTTRYAYSQPGVYHAKLTVTDPGNLSSTVEVIITVTTGPGTGGGNIIYYLPIMGK